MKKGFRKNEGEDDCSSTPSHVWRKIKISKPKDLKIPSSKNEWRKQKRIKEMRLTTTMSQKNSKLSDKQNTSSEKEKSTNEHETKFVPRQKRQRITF